jgi:hypothetical protein
MTKYNKYGKGWFKESERHSLASRGISTGRFKKEKYPLIYKTIFPFIPMTLAVSPGSKEFIKRRASESSIKTLLNHGWQMKVNKYDLSPNSIELWKGKNFVYASPTHWGKYEIKKVMLFDEKEKQQLREVFRKPYPYKIVDYSKRQKSEFCVTVKDLDLEDVPDKFYKFDYGTDLQHNEFEIYFNTKEQVKEFEKFVKSKKNKYYVHEYPLDKSDKIKRELSVRFRGVDRQGRKMWMNVNTDRVYKEVDGELHTITSQGEPLVPINKNIKIRFV